MISDAWILGSSAEYPSEAEVPVEQAVPTAQIVTGATPPVLVSGDGAGTNQVSVGQQIQLTGSVNNLGGLTVVSQVWSVPGNTVTGYTQTLAYKTATAPATCSAPAPTQFAAGGPTQPQITFYWIDGYAGPATMQVTCTASPTPRH